MLFFFIETYNFRLFLHPNGACKPKGTDDNLTNSDQCSNSQKLGQILQPSLCVLNPHSFILVVFHVQQGNKNKHCSLKCFTNNHNITKIKRNIVLYFLRFKDNVVERKYYSERKVRMESLC